MTVDVTEAQRLVEALNRDYAHCIDDDRLEEWPALFTADGRYAITTRENVARGLPVGVMTCESPGMMQDRVLALRKANIYEAHTYRHLISAVRVTGRENGVWRAEAGYAVIRTMQEGDMAIFSVGKYVDKIAIADGAAKFKERIVIADSQRIDTLIVIPL
jgi:anthranilate 1,2-dioxygenase small subunit